jgi:hypothetical protein
MKGNLIMKTNKMLRLASILLVAAMVSTCAISGTFAKYVTSDSKGDSAKVAKFGVVVTTTGSIFKSQYDSDTNNFGYTGLSVQNKTDDKNLVAPGTKNTDKMYFSVTGTPEVAVNVNIAVNVVEDVFLAKKDGLPNMTTGNAEDTFNNTESKDGFGGEGYYPVVFTLTNTTTGTVATGNLKDIKKAFEDLSKNWEPGTNLEEKYGNYELTWAWAYGDEDTDTGFDAHDTLLGDLQAGTTLTPSTTLTNGTDYNLDIDFTVTITVTQID